MTEEKVTRGVNPLGDRKLTATEVKRRQRMKKKLLRDEMIKQGYLPCEVFLHPAQIKALQEKEAKVSSDVFDSTKLSQWLFAALKNFLGTDTTEIEAEGKVAILDKNGLPKFSMHESALFESRLKYDKWSKEQIEGLS